MTTPLPAASIVPIPSRCVKHDNLRRRRVIPSSSCSLWCTTGGPKDASMRDHVATTLKLVELLYEAVADAGAWPAFLEGLAAQVGGVAPGIYLTQPATDATLFQVASGLDPSWTSAYESYFKRCDPRRACIKALPAGSVFVGSALVPDRELVRSEFYNDFLRPQGYFHILGT